MVNRETSRVEAPCTLGLGDVRSGRRPPWPTTSVGDALSRVRGIRALDRPHLGQQTAQVGVVELVLSGRKPLAGRAPTRSRTASLSAVSSTTLNRAPEQISKVGLKVRLRGTAECGRLSHGRVLAQSWFHPVGLVFLGRGSYPLLHSPVTQISTRLGARTQTAAIPVSQGSGAGPTPPVILGERWPSAVRGGSVGYDQSAW